MRYFGRAKMLYDWSSGTAVDSQYDILAAYLEIILGVKFALALKNDIVVLGCFLITWGLLGASPLGAALTSSLCS